MKNKIALAAAFMAATSYSTAEIVINDFLSFEGFVDSSYSHTDVEIGDEEMNENSFNVDQVEISWLFDFDPVTAQVDFTHLGSDSNRANRSELDNGDIDVSNTGVEQAFATYHMDNGSAITAGLYASMLGFEAFEPTGLYQYSFAYDMMIGDTTLLPGYAQGVKYTYETDTSFFGISLQDEAFDNGEGALGGNPDSSYAVEVAGSLILADGLTGFVGGAFEDAEDADNYALNAYLTYETGAWIFAAEANYGDIETGSALAGAAVETATTPVADGGFGVTEANGFDEEVLQFLLMANFAYSEQASITGRLSYTDHEADLTTTGPAFGGKVEADAFKYTLAHGYAFTDNLFLVTEVSYVDGDFDVEGLGGEDFEGLQGAVELIFSF